MHTAINNMLQTNDCIICTMNCTEKLDCGHYYHATCIRTWFNINFNYKCLYCFKFIPFKELCTYINQHSLQIKGDEQDIDLIDNYYTNAKYLFTEELFYLFIKKNNLNVINYLQFKKFAYNKTQAFAKACEYSTVNIIRHFDTKFISETTVNNLMENSIIESNLTCIDYLISNYPYCRDISVYTQYAVLQNDLNLLKHLLNADFKISNCLMEKAMLIDNLEMVRFLYLLGLNTFSAHDVIKVLKHGHVKVLRFLADVKPDIFNVKVHKIRLRDMNIIIRTCSISMLKYLTKAYTPFNSETIDNACFNINPTEIIKHLYDYGCNFSTTCFQNICLLNLICTTEYITSLKLDIDVMGVFIATAYEYKNIEIINILLDQGYRLL